MNPAHRLELNLLRRNTAPAPRPRPRPLSAEEIKARAEEVRRKDLAKAKEARAWLVPP